MSWDDCLVDGRGLRAFFSMPPDLSRVDLHEIRFLREASRILIRFDLFELPDRLPDKWRLEGYNKVQLQLAVIEVSKVTLEGWNHSVIASIRIDERVDDIEVRIEGEMLSAQIIGRFLALETISGYQDAGMSG